MGQSPDSSSYNTQRKGLPLVQGNSDIKERVSFPQRYTSCPIKFCVKGSVLLSVRAPVGTVGIANQDLCIGRGICAIQYENNEFMYQFLLKNENSWKSIEQGGTFTSINSDDIKNFLLFIPEKPECNKISNFLSLVDRRIDKQKELIDNLKKYKRGFFLKIYNDSKKDIVLFKNMYKIASEGGTPSTTDISNYKNGTIPFIKIDDLKNHYLKSAKYFITEKGLRNSNAWLIPENSIIYSNGATIGACSINKFPIATKQGILGIVPKNDFSVEFMYFLFTSPIFFKKIRSITTKVTMDCAYLKDINNIKIDIPNIIQQQKIASIMVNFENNIEHNTFTLEVLQNLKKGLLQQMFI